MTETGTELQTTGSTRGWMVPVAVGGLALVGAFVVLSALTSILFSWLPLLLLAGAGWGLWRLMSGGDRGSAREAHGPAPPASLPAPTGPPSPDVLKELETLKARTRNDRPPNT